MGTPYIGEIRIFAGNYAPAGWRFCDGSLLSIAENDALFNLIGTTYGGDGQSTFAVPDLRGRIPLHMGGGFTIGQAAGSESVTLTVQQIPAHEHSFEATTAVGNLSSPVGNVVAQSPQIKLYIEDAQDANFAANAIGLAGGSQPHENRMPYMGINYIISLFGIFPPRS